MTCRVSRSTAGTPSRSSSKAELAGWTAPSSDVQPVAACLKLRWRAAASKARRALSGGSRYVHGRLPSYAAAAGCMTFRSF